MLLYRLWRGKDNHFGDIRGPTEVRELESIPLRAESHGATGASVEWAVVPSDAGVFSDPASYRTSFRANPVAGPTNVTLYVTYNNDQHSTVVRRNLTITDMTGWFTKWGGGYWDKTSKIETDPMGISYVLGDFMSGMEVEINGEIELFVSTEGSRDGYLMCLDLDGEIQRMKNIFESRRLEDAIEFHMSGDGSLYSVLRSYNYVTTHWIVMKHDRSGNEQWQFIFPGKVLSLETDSYGDFYMTGAFEGTVDLDPGPGVDTHSTPNRNIFFCKFDSGGNYLWGYSWGNTGYTTRNKGITVLTDVGGYTYVMGYFTGNEIDFDPGPGEDIHDTPLGATGGTFISRYTSSGGYDKTWTFMGNVREIEADSYSNIFVYGTWLGPIDFDLGPGEMIIESNGMHIAKYSPEMELLWADVWPDGRPGLYSELEIDYEDGLVLVGDLKGGEYYDFDPGPGEAPVLRSATHSGFILRLDSDGEFRDVEVFGQSRCVFIDVSLDAGGNAFIVGKLQGGMLFDDMWSTNYVQGTGHGFVLSVYE